MARFLLHYQLKSSRLPYPPMFVQLEPTNVCNLRCTTCPQGDDNREIQKGFMSLELFRKLVDQAASFSSILVVLHLSGEPLLHKELPQMVALVKERGLDVDFSTNGMLLTEEKANSLVKAGLDSIRIDFSPNKEAFERIRKGARWEVVRDNLAYLLRLKKKLKQATPLVRIQNVALGDTYPYDHQEDIDRIRQMFAGLPVDEISGLAIHTWSGKFAQDHEKNTQYQKRHDTRYYYPCPHLWSQINVTWNGMVVACCRDLMGEYVVGDASRKSLAEIWNDRPLMTLRATLAAGNYRQVNLCRSCTKLWEGKSPRRLIGQHLQKIAFRCSRFLLVSK